MPTNEHEIPEFDGFHDLIAKSKEEYSNLDRAGLETEASYHYIKLRQLITEMHRKVKPSIETEQSEAIQDDFTLSVLFSILDRCINDFTQDKVEYHSEILHVYLENKAKMRQEDLETLQNLEFEEIRDIYGYNGETDE